MAQHAGDDGGSSPVSALNPSVFAPFKDRREFFLQFLIADNVTEVVQKRLFTPKIWKLRNTKLGEEPGVGLGFSMAGFAQRILEK